MTMADRQRKARVLEALERRARQFRGRDEIWPLRIPREPLPFDDVLEEALADDGRRFDPLRLKSRSLLHLRWKDGSTWEAWVIVLPSGRKLYCDSGAEETRILASGGRNAGDESDRVFLELLAASAGEHFGIEMSGDAPTRVRSAITNRTFLIDLFVDLFEAAGIEEAVGRHANDFRSDVERWLDSAAPDL